MWGFPKIGVPQNEWFMMENPIKMDDLGVPLLLETPMYFLLKIGDFSMSVFRGAYLEASYNVPAGGG